MTPEELEQAQQSPPVAPEQMPPEGVDAPPIEDAPPVEAGMDEVEPPSGTSDAPPANRFAERLSKRYPDKEFKSDDEINDALAEYLDELEGESTSNKEANEKLLDVFEMHPEVVGIIKDLAKGAGFTEALSRHVDVEELSPIEGDPDYDAWNTNIEERRKKREEQQGKAKMLEENVSKSIEEIDAFSQENNMTPEETQGFLQAINGLIEEVVDGKLTKDTLAKMRQAINYTKDVETAAKQGETAGKNAKIEKVKKTEKEKTKGDGLPAVTGSGSKTQPEPPAQKSDPFYEAAEMEKQRRTIL